MTVTKPPSLLPALAAEPVERIVAGDAEPFQVEVLADEPREQGALLVPALAAVGIEPGELLVGEEDGDLVDGFFGHDRSSGFNYAEVRTCRINTYFDAVIRTTP